MSQKSEILQEYFSSWRRVIGAELKSLVPSRISDKDVRLLDSPRAKQFLPTDTQRDFIQSTDPYFLAKENGSSAPPSKFHTINPTVNATRLQFCISRYEGALARKKETTKLLHQDLVELIKIAPDILQFLITPEK